MTDTGGMHTVMLGGSGEKVGAVALGCMLMGTATPEPEAVRTLDAFVDAGGTMLDTANGYAWWSRPGSAGGESEELLGRWLSRGGHRDRVFLATKIAGNPVDHASVWRDGAADWDLAWNAFEGAGADVVAREVDACLRRLRTDRIDLLYIHVDDRRTPLEETLAALDEVVHAGKVRHIGWSNVRTWRLERARALAAAGGWPAPVVVQQCFSYLRPRGGQSHPESPSYVDDEMLDYLAAHEDLALVAYSPILKGSYDDPANPAKRGLLDDFAGPHNDARRAVLEQVAAEAGATPNQTVLAWMLRLRPTVVPLIGPRTFAQYENTIAALGVSLDADQMDRLNAA